MLLVAAIRIILSVTGGTTGAMIRELVAGEVSIL